MRKAFVESVADPVEPVMPLDLDCYVLHSAGDSAAELSRLTPSDEFKGLINSYMASFAEESGGELLAETGMEGRRLAIGNVKFVRSNPSRPTPTESWRYICPTGSNIAKAAASLDETE